MSFLQYFSNLNLRKNQLLNAVLHKISTNNNLLTHAGQVGYREDLGKMVLRDGSSAKNIATEDYVQANAGGSPDWSVIQNKPTTFTPSTHNHAIADIAGLQNQLNAINNLLTSDNVNLDTLQEIVDAVEVLQSIVVNDLTTGGTTKALSAQQGVVLKALIDALTTTVAGKQDNLGFTPYNATNPSNYVSLATILATVNTYSRAQVFGIVTLTDASTISWDLDTAQSAQVTLGGNRTLANPSNIRNGGNYQLNIIQDATGNRTLTFGTAYRFPNGITPTLSATPNTVDLLSCHARNGILQCVLTKGY